ncbi:MAG: DoxX family protein [Candidatus Nanohaloarchaeota archaeon QJJ-7]|nr:DoxX family protein [Candidatus Nanohaloarchaeota archaeon QJJ-7]
MSSADVRTEIFGRRKIFEYSERWVGYSILALRLVMGWTLFYGGVTKLMDPGWSAAGYLSGVAASNPFQTIWTVLANEWLWLVDPLNAWGLTLVGLGLMAGALVRWNAFWGSVLMAFYWISSFPLSHAMVVDYHVVYIFLLFGLGTFGAGRLFGLDSYLERTDIVEENPWIRYLLG